MASIISIIYIASIKSVEHPKSLVPYGDSSDESTDDLDSPSTPKQVLVSTDVHVNALIHPVTKNAKRTTKEKSPKKKSPTKKSPTEKEQCPPGRCVMKRANKRTWWVQCVQCTQWYHIRCVKLTKKEAQDNEFTCEDCI